MAFQLTKRLKAGWQGITLQSSALSDLRHPTAWLQNWALGGQTLSGINVSPESAYGLSAYFAAVRAISEDVAKLPLKTYRRLDRGKEVFPDHPLYPILHDAPNEFMSSMNWRESMTSYALTWGNAYAPIDWMGLTVTGLGKAIHPSRVQPFYDEQGNLAYDVWVDDLDIRSEAARPIPRLVFPQWRMFHLRGLGDGIIGKSVAQLARESLGLSIAAQQFGSSFFGNGANLGGVLTHPGTLGETAEKNLRESWQSTYGGAVNAGKVAILEEGMKYERVGIPPEDAQFLVTREFQITEMARWFRIPPHKIAYLKDATFSNIEEQAREYVDDCLMSWLVRWEQEIQRKLFGIGSDYFAKHVVLGLLRGNQAARADYYTKRFNVGSLSPNDIRELEDENPIPGEAGDKYFVQINLGTLESVAGTGGNVPPAAQQPPALVPAGNNGHVHYED